MHSLVAGDSLYSVGFTKQFVGRFVMAFSNLSKARIKWYSKDLKSIFKKDLQWSLLLYSPPILSI